MGDGYCSIKTVVFAYIIWNSFFKTKIKCKYLSTGERMNMIVQKFDLLFIRIGALTVNLGADFDRLLNQIHFNFSL